MTTISSPRFPRHVLARGPGDVRPRCGDLSTDVAGRDCPRPTAEHSLLDLALLPRRSPQLTWRPHSIPYARRTPSHNRAAEPRTKNP